MKRLFFIISIIFLVGIFLFLWIQYYNKKAPKIIDKLLSKNDMDAINSYKAKYQNFPGPSDAEVQNVVKILLSSKLTSDKVEKLLGKPSDILEITSVEENQPPSIRWGYDIGDNRRMSIIFDSNNNLISIHGAGVGVDELTLPPKK